VALACFVIVERAASASFAANIRHPCRMFLAPRCNPCAFVPCLSERQAFADQDNIHLHRVVRCVRDAAAAFVESIACPVLSPSVV
jgi:hypothetical protein